MDYQDVNVRKEPVSKAKAMKIAKEMKQIHAKVGAKLKSWDLSKEKMSNEELNKALIGRSGDMRAPVLIVGKTLMAGFDESTYKNLLKL